MAINANQSNLIPDGMAFDLNRLFELYSDRSLIRNQLELIRFIQFQIACEAQMQFPKAERIKYLCEAIQILTSTAQPLKINESHVK